MVLGLDPTVVAHFDQLNIIRLGVHPVLVLQLFNNPVNGAGNTKRLSTLDALERFLAMQRPGAQRILRQIQLGFQCDGRLGAGTLADATLDAGVFGKADFWPIRVIAQGPGRTQRHTGQAERAFVGINLDGAIGCAGRQRNRRFDVSTIALAVTRVISRRPPTSSTGSLTRPALSPAAQSSMASITRTRLGEFRVPVSMAWASSTSAATARRSISLSGRISTSA